jgi:hypothetical protein
MCISLTYQVSVLGAKQAQSDKSSIACELKAIDLPIGPIKYICFIMVKSYCVITIVSRLSHMNI